MKTVNRPLLCLVLTAFVIGCGVVPQIPPSCWDTVPQEPTIISPTFGDYSAGSTSTAPEANMDNEQNPVYPLSHWGFSVVVPDASDPVGDPFVRFSSDGSRYDRFRVSGGVFSHVHGHHADNTVCPTDGYSISGRFDSPTTASGHFEYIPACVCTNGGDFRAQHQPENVPAP